MIGGYSASLFSVCQHEPYPTLRGPVDLERQKELFSEAYLRAISSIAACALTKPEVDDDSVDWVLTRRQPGHPSLDVQLKATARDVMREDGLHFQLKEKNFEDLRAEDLLYPRILVVVLLPDDDPATWLARQTDEELALRRCGYWRSLRGHAAAARNPTVVVPRENVLTPAALVTFMDRISRRLPL